MTTDIQCWPYYCLGCGEVKGRYHRVPDKQLVRPVRKFEDTKQKGDNMKFTIEENKTGKVSKFPCWMIGAHCSSGNIYLFLSENECISFEAGCFIKKYTTSPSSAYKPFHGTFTIEVD